MLLAEALRQGAAWRALELLRLAGFGGKEWSLATHEPNMMEKVK